MNLLAEFHFLRPWWLLMLALAPFVIWFWRRRRGQAGNWQAVVDAHLLPHLVDQQTEPTGRGHLWLAASLVVLAGLALAGPAWERQPLPLVRNDAARILAIELAPTMLAADIKPTRLERARYKLNDILTASRDMQTALVGYSGDAFVAAPLTDDANTVRNLVDALGPGVMPVVGNNTDRAIAEALKLVEQAGLERGELILLADSAGERAIDAARAAHARGLRISVLGVGTPQGAPVPLPQGGFLQDDKGNIVLPRLDEAGLRALAQAGGGRYARLTADRSDLEILLDLPRGESSSATREGDPVSSERYLDRGPWLVLLLLPLALLAFRRGWLMLLPLALLAPVPPAQAMEWIDLWKRPDQQAAEALAAGDTERAQAAASDPQWRGSAAYRAGDYAAATRAFASASGAQALYNQGNALAREGRYEEAIDAYSRALEIDPGLEDAAANKQAVEDWLKRKQSQQENERPDNKQGAQENPGSPQEKDGSEQNAGEAGREGDESAGSPEEPDRHPGESDAERETKSSSQGEPTPEERDPPSSSADSSGDDATDPGDATGTSADVADQAQRRADQQSRLSRAIDKALESEAEEGQPAQALQESTDPAAEEQLQAHKQWLQRVPDDPGGLLRRKFQLEYDRRQRDGGN